MVECLSIKMRFFKRSNLVILFLSLVLSSNAAPRQPSSIIARSSEESTSANEEKPLIGDHYDQRQNGTENYRIHVDGLVLVVAPIEGLLLAGGLPGVGDSNIFGTPGPIVDKPKPEAPTAIKPTTEASEEKPSSAKSSHGSGLRLINLLSPFLRRVHHPHQ